MLNVVAALFRIYCRVQDLQHNVMGSPSSPLQGRVALAKSDGPIYLLPKEEGVTTWDLILNYPQCLS